MIIYADNIYHKPKKVHISESKIPLLAEDVYTSDIRNKRGRGAGQKKLVLTYNKRKSADMTKVHGKVNKYDYLDTGKMDQDNHDTYEVPLKGGIMSYNITSIKGTEVMHYFKNKRKASMKIDTEEGGKEEYELWMDDPEYNEFINMFCRKVGNVIEYASNKIYSESTDKIEFRGISILPVYSSSDFNSNMVDTLVKKGVTFDGLPVVKINQNLFTKDTSNIQKDKDFIKKNKEYYQSRMFKGGDNDISHEGYIDNELKRFDKINSVKPYIDTYNEEVKKLIICYTNHKSSGENGTKSWDEVGKLMAKHYLNMYRAYEAICKAKGGMEADKIFKQLKGTKTHRVEINTEAYWNLVKKHLRGTGCKQLPIVKLEAQMFQIKNLSNDVRMGLMNYFKTDEELVKSELEKIEGTIFVIFDDNISGGATLSDICYRAKELGVKYIIPITFGEMTTKYTFGRATPINKPSKSGRFQNY